MRQIVWLLLNLWNISERNQLLVQVNTGRGVLKNLILKVIDEIPDNLLRIHTDHTYGDKLINHPLFQRDQIWYLDRKVSGSSCHCSGCLPTRFIQNNDLHLYVQDLLRLKEQRVVDTKLRFCLSACCGNGIPSLYKNIRPLDNKSVLLEPQIESITAVEKEKVFA